MRTRAAVLTCIAALLVGSCGGATVLPTSPTLATLVPSNSQAALAGAAQQSLVGAWRGSVRSAAVRIESGTAVGFALNCSQRWEISSQSGRQFEGEMWSQGAGPESDWRCAQTRRFSGEMMSDDQVLIRFVPRHTLGGCTDLVGGESAVGSMSGGAIVIALPYRATCEMTPGGAAPSWELEIAATITLTPG